MSNARARRPRKMGRLAFADGLGKSLAFDPSPVTRRQLLVRRRIKGERETMDSWSLLQVSANLFKYRGCVAGLRSSISLSGADDISSRLIGQLGRRRHPFLGI